MAGVAIAYQGEPGAYSEEALLRLYPDARTVPCRTFGRAFDALGGGEVSRAVLPVENSLGGIVQEVNDLLWGRPGLRVTAEVVHPIKHCLLGRARERPERAISHPQALAQCAGWLQRRGIQPVPFHDTAGAARQLAEWPQPGTAAIASATAAARYGLDILARDIQDDDSNRTRFLVVEKGEPVRPAAAQAGWKCCLAFVGAHRPGGLVEALKAFSERGVNLTRLDSRPIPEQPFNYKFYLDFEISDPAGAETALSALEDVAAEVRFFGSYAPVD
ncbi:MAG TPA: prephenate dehydratase [Candidatus Dormibacteraeota bacterium]